jgi:hypothetical protein
MPPVMGAAAFVMAEITNIPDGDIVVAAAIGAVMHHFAILAAVHFEAKKLGIEPMALKDIPAWREVLPGRASRAADWLAGLSDDRTLERQFRRLSVQPLAMVGVSLLRARTRMGWRRMCWIAWRMRASPWRRWRFPSRALAWWSRH